MIQLLRFITGTGGTGKTHYIYQQLQQELQNGNEKLLLLVPDQSTFATEKALLEFLGAPQARHVLTFGFQSLCRHVYDLCSVTADNVIDNGTRAVIMSVAIEQLSEKLHLFSGGKNRNLTTLMLRTLSECKKNGVTPEQLRNASLTVSDRTLRQKLGETSLVFETFDAILSQSYIDPLDDLERLAALLCDHPDLLSGYTVCIDSFSGFTAMQLRVLEQLMTRCAAVYVALTFDADSKEEDEVFATSRETARRLLNLARKNGVDIKAPVKLCEPRRFVHGELADLEQRLFRLRRTHAPLDYVPEHISVFEASDSYSECEYVARQIKHLIIEQGCSYGDIAVICHDSKPYRGVIDVIFEKYGIPFFMDMQQDVEVKPVIRFVNALFRLITDNFERGDVLALLKTGLTQNSLEEISAFENYTYIWNLNNAALRRPFTKHPRGFSDEMTQSDEALLALCERVRQSVAEPVQRFRQAVREQTGREITRCLYELLTEMHVPDTLREMYRGFESRDEREYGAEQIRVWGLLMDALDKMVAVAGDMRLSAQRYFELLSLQTAAMEFAEIPRRLDCVSVTTAQRVRMSDCRTAFVIGCTEGGFPALPSGSGLFSSFELKLLSLNDVKISEDFSDMANLETFMAYSCLTAPGEQLFVSYPTVDLSGARFTPSVIVEEIFRAFPKLCLLDSADFDDRAESMLALRPAFEAFSSSAAHNAVELRGLRAFFEQDPAYAAKTTAVTRALQAAPFAIENPENARRLFGDALRISASQLETFSKCPFSYFCNYGLRIRERLRAEINPMEYGTLVHYILEQFFTAFPKEVYASMDDDAVRSFIDETLQVYIADYFGGAQSKSFLFELQVLSDNVFLLLRHIIAELAQSDFTVADCELKIDGEIPAYTVTLAGGQTVSVRGSVDRVDVLEQNGEKFLRIVDYKTGPKEFALADVLYGINLQMLIYLHSIALTGEERYGSFTPAGILYMPATVRAVNADSLGEKQILSELNKALRMNGLLLDDEAVLHAMDKTDSATYIPITPEATRTNLASRATLDQFRRIFRLLDLTVEKMGNALFSGEIPAAPLKGAHDGCEYCPYGSVCMYRRSEPRESFDKIKKDDFYQQVDERIQGGEGNAE